MGYVFGYKDALAYEKMMLGRQDSFLCSGQEQMVFRLLKPASMESVLSVGCGTGMCLLPLVEKKLLVTGIDPSPYMLDIAGSRLGEKVDLHRGFAENLPFDDNSFNHVCFFSSLEFVYDPEKALEEAFRVAKDKVFIGAFNRYSINGACELVKGLFSESVYSKARFYSVPGLKKRVKKLLGNVPVNWQTLSQIPVEPGRVHRFCENTWFFRKSPFGTYIGMVIKPVPRFRTTPLKLRYKRKGASAALSGFASSGNCALKKTRKPPSV